MKNILIVGGAGYLGGCVVHRTQPIHNVRVYDNLTYEDAYRKPVSFVYGDVRDNDKLIEQLEWADVVVWLAAIVGDGACQINPKMTIDINYNSLKTLVENFNKRIIFISTCSVYGINNDLIDENSPTNPLSLYASSKLNAESLLANKDAIIFRLGTLYGLSDEFSRIRMDLVVNTLTINAHINNRINIFGGDQYRPLIHVQDVAAAVVDAINSYHTGIYNLSSINLKIIDIATFIKQAYPDCMVDVSSIPYQDIRNYKVSSQKAEIELHFKPRYTIIYGIMELRKLLNEHRIKDINNSRYSNHKYIHEMEVTNG